MTKTVDGEVDRLVAHGADVHGHVVRVGRARDLGDLLLGPDRLALVPVGIDRVDVAGAGLHRAVDEELHPPRHDVPGGVPPRVERGREALLKVHPALELVVQAEQDVQVAGFVELPGGLVGVVVEVVGPAVYKHRVALRQQVPLDLGHDRLRRIDGVDVLVVQEGTSHGAGRLLQKARRRAVGAHHDLAAADVVGALEHLAVLEHVAGVDEAAGVRQALVALVVGDVYGDVDADLVELLAGGHVVLGVEHVPAEAEDGGRPGLACPPDRGGHDLAQELIRVDVRADHDAHLLDGKAHRVVRVAVAARRHHEALVGVVNDLGPSLLDICLCLRPVADVDVPAVPDGERLCDLAVLGGVDLAEDHEVRGLGRPCGVAWCLGHCVPFDMSPPRGCIAIVPSDGPGHAI